MGADGHGTVVSLGDKGAEKLLQEWSRRGEKATGLQRVPKTVPDGFYPFPGGEVLR